MKIIRYFFNKKFRQDAILKYTNDFINMYDKAERKRELIYSESIDENFYNENVI